MPEASDAIIAIKAKTRADLIIEVSQLIDEIRVKVRKSKREKAYSRYVNMLTTLYGILKIFHHISPNIRLVCDDLTNVSEPTMKNLHRL